ncbi:hypothetical protein C8R42DRAFT_217598 [Lentinula raphanica]|nr:hypothetical protein C8R42DRAFT_217598 [Lentinula raphanica]
MPYSQPALSPRSPSPSRYNYPRSSSSHSIQNQNTHPSTQSLGRPGHRRSYSSQAHYGFEPSSSPAPIAKSSSTDTARFSNEQSIEGSNVSRGAWGGLGSLPRRHSSATTPTLTTSSKFRIGDRRGSNSSDDDDENDDENDHSLPPLKLKVQVLPSFSGGVPFPKSSVDSPVRTGPMSIPNPANVSITRSSAPARTSSSPAVISPEFTPAPSVVSTRPASPVILLSNGKPLRSSLKGSRVSSLLNSPMGSAANSPSPSPANSTKNSPSNSTSNSAVTSPIMSPSVPGASALSFASFTNLGTDSAAKLLVPPSFGGHVRAQSAPSPPMSPGQQGIEAVLDSTWTGLFSEAALSPGISEPPMSPDGLLSPRSVHFPSLPTDLEHVRVFRKEARPSSLLVTRKERDQHTSSLDHNSNSPSNGAESAEGSGTDVRSGGEETETETETDREYGYGYNAGYWGTWGGRSLWNAAASSKPHGSSSAKASYSTSKDQPGAFPFPRLPRLGRSRSAGNKDEDEGESSSSSSSSGGRVRIRNTGTGPRFARSEEGAKEQVGRSNEKEKSRKVKTELDVPSVIPRPEAVQEALSGSSNVFLEELHLETSMTSSPSPVPSSKDTALETFALEGTFLVRNITFEKSIHVRFTTDDWSTVNEVRGNWVGSCGRSRLIALAAKSGSGLSIPRTVGDLIAFPSYSSEKENSSEWDRFAFRINLPPAVVRSNRVVEFVGRYAVGNAGGEWWDNCGGKNWKVGFRKVEITEPAISVPTLLTTSPSPDPVPALKSETKTLPSISPITPDIPVSTSSIDVQNDSAVVTSTLDPTSTSGVLDPSIPKESSSLGSSSDSVEPVPDKPKVDVQEVGNEQGAKEAVKERAPKPTGLGSFGGLGGLFWPWRNVHSSDAPQLPVSSYSLSSHGTVEPPDSLPPTPSGPVANSPIGNTHSLSTQGSRDLPASATVEVLSVIPPGTSLKEWSPKLSPNYGPSLFSKGPGQRERIPSGNSVSSISSTDSVDSMMDVPVLERSGSLSSVSSDGGEFGELAEFLHRNSPLPKLNSGGDSDLTPVPKGVSVGWGSNAESVGEDETGFFDRAGPGSVGGVGIVSPSASGDKPMDTDPLYRAFVQQWCFAGTGNGSPLTPESPTHEINRSRLEVM